ncbi:MAG: hypothetical protein SEPTF4163_004204 [Sporothrix epigloea]
MNPADSVVSAFPIGPKSPYSAIRNSMISWPSVAMQNELAMSSVKVLADNYFDVQMPMLLSAIFQITQKPTLLDTYKSRMTASVPYFATGMINSIDVHKSSNQLDQHAINEARGRQ